MNFLMSTLALVGGPFIYAWGRRQPVVKQLLDGFVLVAVAGIVCVNIIPDALDNGGLLAVVALAAGLVFPVGIEHAFRRSAHEAHVFIVVLAAAGLVVHALLDGIALLPTLGNGSPATSVPGNSLALGVILHRLPVGMALWWSVRPAFGLPATIATFALVIAATAASYFFGGPVVALAEAPRLALFQAFVAGSLVHVVAFGVSHRHERDEPFVPADNWGFRAGILLGMFVVFAVPHLH